MAVAQKQSPSTSTLRIPQQFKPHRPIPDGPFGPWAENVLGHSKHLTRADLNPTPEDLRLVSQLAYQRDEIGDRLADRLLADRKVARQLDQGLKQGIASLDNPAPELVEFLHYYENIPDWAYLPELEAFLAESRGKPTTSAARRATPEFALDGLSMATGFFLGANYPAVGQALVATGSVASGSNRMVQTMNYVEDLVNVRGLLPHGRAVQSSARVRLAHAFARRQIEQSGLWDKDYYGEIISEFDNMIFMSGLTLVPDLPSFARLSDRSKQAMKLQTKAMQYLLGAPKELVTMPIEGNQRFFAMVVAHLDDSPGTARQVVEAFRSNPYFRPTDTIQGKISRELAFLSANLMIRVGWGNRMADSIGLERTYLGMDLGDLAQVIDRPPVPLAQLGTFATKSAPQLEQVAKIILRRSRLLKAAVRRVTKHPKGQASDELLYRGSYGAFA